MNSNKKEKASRAVTTTIAFSLLPPLLFAMLLALLIVVTSGLPLAILAGYGLYHFLQIFVSHDIALIIATFLSMSISLGASQAVSKVIKSRVQYFYRPAFYLVVFISVLIFNFCPAISKNLNAQIVNTAFVIFLAFDRFIQEAAKQKKEFIKQGKPMFRDSMNKYLDDSFNTDVWWHPEHIVIEGHDNKIEYRSSNPKLLFSDYSNFGVTNPSVDELSLCAKLSVNSCDKKRWQLDLSVYSFGEPSETNRNTYSEYVLFSLDQMISLCGNRIEQNIGIGTMYISAKTDIDQLALIKMGFTNSDDHSLGDLMIGTADLVECDYSYDEIEKYGFTDDWIGSSFVQSPK